jgi:hypothetical protein
MRENVLPAGGLENRWLRLDHVFGVSSSDYFADRYNGMADPRFTVARPRSQTREIWATVLSARHSGMSEIDLALEPT